MRVILLALMLCTLAVVSVGSTASAAASFAGGLPMATLQGMFAGQVPAAEKAVAESLKLPPSCCWDNVGAKTVHLCLQSQTISNVALSAKLDGAASGVVVPFSGSGTYGAHYRLCAKEFIGGCSKLFNCDGEAAVVGKVSGSVPVALAVASDGHVELTPGTAAASVSTPSDSFCSKISGEVSKTVSGMGPKLADDVKAAVAKSLASIAAKIPYTKVVGGIVRGSWVGEPAASSLSAKTGLLLTGDVTVSDVASGANIPAPFTPSGPLPDVAGALASSKAAFAFSDSVAANFAWAAWKAGALALQFNKTVDGVSIVGSGDVTSAPSIVFGPGDGSDIAVSFNASAHVDSAGTLLAPTFSVSAGVNVTFNATADGFTASIVLNELSVANVSTFAGAAIKVAALKAVTDINAKLLDMAIHIPVVDGVDLQSPSLTFSSGAVLLTATPVVHPAYTLFSDATTATGLTEIPCPAIPGAHLDSCSVC